MTIASLYVIESSTNVRACSLPNCQFPWQPKPFP